MCLGIPGRVVETFPADDVLMGRGRFRWRTQGGLPDPDATGRDRPVRDRPRRLRAAGNRRSRSQSGIRVLAEYGRSGGTELRAAARRSGVNGVRYQAEYRDAKAAKKLQRAIAKVATQPWTIMEVCGGQTHTLVRYGIDELLPNHLELVHGPGCPVCVTPLELIDKAIEIASRDDVIFCSFGDMLRVPGSQRDLFDVKASGGDLRIVYSPLDCLKIAEQNPQRTVVFFAVGFETTAPANAMALWQAKRREIGNFAVLVSHVLVPPAIEAILASPTNRVQGFFGAGHVCSVMGYEQYEPIATKYRIPIVVTGFEPVDLLEGIYRCVRMLERGEVGVENQYARAVQREGSRTPRN